ncbi:MAG TPA: TrkA family potassium uptake protein, partial [Polyangiaceae bacterium]|nr:TrkA family potassium uptake protein [Polyangiaceae bacterium]
MAQKRVLVIGLGRFGAALAAELWETGCELIVVDKDPEAIDPFKAKSGAAFVADANDPGVLESLGAKDVDVAVVTSGEDFEGTVLAVSQLAQLGVKTIFARAASERQAHVLRAVGATRAIQVEDEMGHRVAVQVLNPASEHLMDFATHFRVVPWLAVPAYVGKTLAEAGFRKFEINVLGVFQKDTQAEPKPKLQLAAPDCRIQQGDTLLLVGEEEKLE